MLCLINELWYLRTHILSFIFILHSPNTYSFFYCFYFIFSSLNNKAEINWKSLTTWYIDTTTLNVYNVFNFIIIENNTQILRFFNNLLKELIKLWIEDIYDRFELFIRWMFQVFHLFVCISFHLLFDWVLISLRHCYQTITFQKKNILSIKTIYTQLKKMS